MSFRGSLCLAFSYHIHGSDTDYLTVFMKQGEETSVVFHEGLYDYNKWQKAHVMLVTNGTFKVISTDEGSSSASCSNVIVASLP